MAATTVVAVSTVALVTLLEEALGVADSGKAALDPESRLASSPVQYLARRVTRHRVTMAVTGRVTTTIHMPTITATAAVTITAMRFAMASSASQEHFSVARTGADTSASRNLRSARPGAFFLPPA